MRKVIVLCGLLSALGLAASVHSAESELDTDLMQSIDDTNKSLSSNIALKDVKAATADSKELNDMFDKVEVYFVNKGGADDAVDLARKSKDLTQQIVRAVDQHDFDGASNSATALSRNCRTCHTFYKKE
jgi:hypothetical protein